MQTIRSKRMLVAAPLAVSVAITANVTGVSSAVAANGGGARTVDAKKYAQVVARGREPVYLEGGTFAANGDFYFNDILARPGTAKVLRFDPKTKRVTGLYTDDTSQLTSTQISPANGRLYTTDYHGGRILSLNLDGSDARVLFSGELEGRKVIADDISFDPEGNLYVTDTAGNPWNPIGRVIRFDPNGQHPNVLLNGLAAANGISFTPDYSRLWISENTGGQEVLLTLNQARTAVTSAHVGMRHNTGVGVFDSNAVDAAGNVYQCITFDDKILVWDKHGNLKQKIRIRQDVPKAEIAATNLAVKPGTQEGFVVVGGPDGGFIYTFKALAPGIPATNGGTILG